MAKKMCDWKKKDIEKDFEKYAAIVSKPTHVCMKCGRTADDKKRLCKAEELPK